MSHRTNGRQGLCEKCQVSVAPGAGTLLGPPWKVICQACLPFPVGQASTVTIAVTKVAANQLEVAPSGKLGSATWGTYKGILDRAGVRARKDKSGAWHSLGPITCAPELVKALTDAGFVLSVAGEVTQAVEAQAKSATLDIAAADARVAAVDAELAKRGKSLYPFQREGVAWIAPRASALLADEMGLGKGHPVDTAVITPTGPRRIGDLVVGDAIIGSDGRATRITGVFPRGELPVFRVSFSDGAEVLVDGDHLWAAWEHNDWHRGKSYRVLSTADLAAQLRDGAGNRRWRIPMTRPVEFACDADALPLDPYLVGVLLADQAAHESTVSFCTGDARVPEEVRAVLPEGVLLSEHQSEGKATTWSIAGDGARGARNPVLDALRALDMQGRRSYERFVPRTYLFSASEVRIALLQGLMDTDGEFRADGHVEYTTTSPELAADVRFLVESLGGTARLNMKMAPKYQHKGEMRTGRPAYRLTLALPEGVMPARAFAGRYQGRPKYPPTRHIDAIEPAGCAQVVCIAVEATDRLYLTEHCIVTHNTIQALAAIPAGAPVVVVCPAVAKGVWVRETKAWRPDLTPIKVDGRGRFRWPSAGELLIYNDEILPATEVKTGKVNDKGEPIMEPASFLTDAPAGLVVIHDECHRGKNPKAARTQRVRAICKAARGAGGRNIGVSGTPLLNAPPDLWAVLSNFGLANEAFGSWFSFARAMGGHQEEIRARGRREAVKIWVWGGTPTSAAGDALRRVMLRRTKDEVLPDLPPKTYKQVDVEIEDKELVRQLELLQEQAEEAGGWDSFLDYDDRPRARDKEKMLAIDFSEISETRARLANAKLAAALEVVAEYEDAGEPVIVFSAHRAPIEALGKREGWRAIVGGMPAAERTQIEDDFQAGRLKGVALTIGAGGVAITLTRASNAIFIDRSWTPAENQQAEDRIRRIGTTKPVQITDLVAEHPLDQQVTALLVAKQNVINASVEAARVGADQHATNAAQVASGALGAIAGQDDRLAAAAAAKADYEAQLQALLAGLVAEEQAELARAAAEKADPAKALERRIERAWTRFKAQDAGDPRPAASPAEFWALGALAQLAASDADYALELNGVGFNKADCGIGHALARAATSGLTDGGWKMAISVASHYPGQVGRAPTGEA